MPNNHSNFSHKKRFNLSVAKLSKLLELRERMMPSVPMYYNIDPEIAECFVEETQRYSTNPHPTEKIDPDTVYNYGR
jgi:hypothetical protein